MVWPQVRYFTFSKNYRLPPHFQCINVAILWYHYNHWLSITSQQPHRSSVFVFQENAGSPLFITGVVTFLISFSLPFVLVGAFLLYSLCQQVFFYSLVIQAILYSVKRNKWKPYLFSSIFVCNCVFKSVSIDFPQRICSYVCIPPFTSQLTPRPSSRSVLRQFRLDWISFHPISFDLPTLAAATPSQGWAEAFHKRYNFILFIYCLQMLQNDNSPYTLLDVGRPDATRISESANDANKVSSKYFTPFNHRMMQSSFDLCQVTFLY